jgi:hypothetical protein
MTQAERLQKSPAIFRRLTGLSVNEFCRLLKELRPRAKQDEQRRSSRHHRQRQPGAGRPFTLPLADRLLMLLIYYRTYVTHAFLAFLFGVDDSTVCRNIRRLEPLLAQIFRIPEKKLSLTEDEIQEAFFDATEQPTNRPKRKQKAYYSGKKKRHTLKHQVVVVRKKKTRGQKKQRVRIVAVSEAAEGKKHDKKLYDEARMELPPEVAGTGDSGYQGTKLSTPKKKPRGGTLTAEEKAANRRLSRQRIVVEHGIGKMKIWRIAADKYRNPRRRHTLIVKNVVGLHNRMFG